MIIKICGLPVLFFLTVFIFTGCGIEAQESSFKSRIKSLDELSFKSDGDRKKSIEAEKILLLEAYAKLPADTDARGVELGKLNSSSYRFIADIEKQIEKIDADKKLARDIAEQAQFEKQLALLSGDWYGLGMHLLITSDGTVQYERLGNGGKKSLTGGKVVRIMPESFEVKVLVASTTFRIDSPPAKKGSVWTMKVDGIDLKKQE